MKRGVSYEVNESSTYHHPRSDLFPCTPSHSSISNPPPPIPIEPLPPLSLPLYSTHAHPHVQKNPAPTTTTIPFIASSQSRIVDDGVHASIGRGKRETKRQHSSSTTSQPVSRSLSQQATHHHHPSIVTIFINNIYNHLSFEPIMHPGG